MSPASERSSLWHGPPDRSPRGSVADPDPLTASWNALSVNRAERYLRTEDHPSLGSRELLADVLRRLGGRGAFSVLDLGCGNAQLYEYFKSIGLPCRYTGADFSEPLLDAAREIHRGDPNASFVQTDIATLSGLTGSWDVAIFSHVIEMLSAPEDALRAARERARAVVIRFFEPPEFETDVVELRFMDVGEGRTVPYLRRKMSRDHYRLILHKLGCRKVDVYRDDTAKDQVHVLHF
jgi:SAM-dependent methyltransferase